VKPNDFRNDKRNNINDLVAGVRNVRIRSGRVTRAKSLMVGGGLLSIPVGGRKSASADLFNLLLAIEQSGGLLQAQAFGFDDEEVTEEQFESEPAAVDDL